MEIKGSIRKMDIHLEFGYAVYELPLNENIIKLNELINKYIEIKFLNTINCIKCGKETNKSFAQGYCYSCFVSAPETEECVLRPELCQAHNGIARDMEFARKHCLIDHYVYLANTSGLKVGVTRNTQIPTRWLDQGAKEAIILAKTPNRYLAGMIEINLKKYIPDKTNWRKLLQEDADISVNLAAEKSKALNYLPENFKAYYTDNNEIFHIKYPIKEYPQKVNSINLDKQNELSGILAGIKGQYLIFENGNVLNIRKHGGYKIILKYEG